MEKEKKEQVLERCKQMLEESDGTFIIASDKKTLLNGGAIDLLVVVCNLVYNLKKTSSLPKAFIKEGLEYALNFNEEKEKLEDLDLENLIEKLFKDLIR